MKVKFSEAREVKDGNGVVIQKFKVGQVVEMSNASARHWINRGAAVDVQATAQAGREVEAEIAANAVGAEEKPGAVEPADETPEVATGDDNPTSPKRGRGRPRSA